MRWNQARLAQAGLRARLTRTFVSRLIGFCVSDPRPETGHEPRAGAAGRHSRKWPADSVIAAGHLYIKVMPNERSMAGIHPVRMGTALALR